MLRTVNWVARTLGFAWLGLLAFQLAPPHGTAAAVVQVAGYCLLGLALVALALAEAHPVTARYHDRALTVIRGVIVVATGFAAGAGHGGTAMVAFGFVAAMMAGSPAAAGRHRRAAARRPGVPGQRGQARSGTGRRGPPRLLRRRCPAHHPQ
jgi:hypothetical protein